LTDEPAPLVSLLHQVRLTVEYDGTGLGGWQRQGNALSVQGHLEAALARLLGKPTAIAGASRTDAGVHAVGQVAAFWTDRPIAEQGIRRGLNTLLPPGIAITSAVFVDDAFHPRFSATGKHYRYAVLSRPDRSPRFARWAWHRRTTLDLDAMNAAGSALCGEHDFSAFRAAGCGAKSTLRRIDSVTIAGNEAELVTIDVRGNAFLRNMVRIIAGTLVEVGEGRRSSGELPEIIASLDRTRAGQTAPAHGLTLVSVAYDGRRVS
jgi:tRNA pseudouridine38-40 synthase